VATTKEEEEKPNVANAAMITVTTMEEKGKEK